ncbi:MAG: hypothetical protein IJ094_08220 [Bacilli bacterium]|nr:hypothetical protein [Bacilli bacterium]
MNKMNKLIKNSIFVISLVLTFMLFGIANVSATELGEIKNVPVINHINGENSNVNIRFKEGIPYIKLNDFYNLVSSYEININNMGEEVYKITINKDDKSINATINTKEDTLYSNNYGFFTEIPDPEDTTILLKNYISQLVGEPKATSINFTKYNIDLYGEDNDIWLPVTTAFDMFRRQGYYDGTNINVLNYVKVMDLIPKIEYYDMAANYLDSRSGKNVEYDYNELCFLFDYNYGYPTQSLLSDSIKKYGLDYTLENYNDETKLIKEKLLSEDINDYYLGFNLLSSYLFDNGHTNLDIVITNVMYKKYGLSFNDTIGKLYSSKQYVNMQRMNITKDKTRKNITQMRQKALNGSNYIEKGDTALYTFDQFSIDDEKWIEYYKNGGAYPDDVLGNLLTALDKASQNPEIKNFVFDISENGGGLGVAAPIIMDFLGFETNLQFKNTINNQIQRYTLDTDINFDGVYDEKDKISKYNFKYGVLTSNLTYSTANIFASLAKENGFMILGERSGGGACSLYPVFTPENILFSISSPQHIIDKNGDSIDNGAELDANLVQVINDENDYSKYYDLDNLSKLLNDFYKKEEKGISIKTTDNALNASISNTKEELKQIIKLTDEEKKSLQNDENLYVFIEVNDISSTISSEDKKIIKNILDKNSIVGKYLDINLYKQLDGKDKVKILQTNGKVKITLEIPEDLRKENRTFYIVRVHDGKATKIIPTRNGNTLTFETDKFSTYALVYTDTVEETTTTNTTGNPKTGDNIMLYISMLGLSTIGLVGAGIYTKKRLFNR